MGEATLTGNLFIVTAPSGAGKTSLVKALLDTTDGVRVSISYTTRAPRPGEQNGVHYFFVDVPTFERMIKDGAFLEHANVFGNYYGTAHQTVADFLAQGTDVILEIDWQGAQQVRKMFPAATGIFILPPSRTELESRLRNRKTDDDQVIARRISEAVVEMSHYAEFDYVVVNDHFDRALAELRSIISAKRLTLAVQREKLKETISKLLQ